MLRKKDKAAGVWGSRSLHLQSGREINAADSTLSPLFIQSKTEPMAGATHIQEGSSLP